MDRCLQTIFEPFQFSGKQTHFKGLCWDQINCEHENLIAFVQKKKENLFWTTPNLLSAADLFNYIQQAINFLK